MDSDLFDFYEAVGSGFGNDRGNLSDDRGKATHEGFGPPPRFTEVSKPIGAPVGEESSVIGARLGWPAGVLAREEDYRSRVAEEHVPHRVDRIYSPLFVYPRPEVTWSRIRFPSPPRVAPRNVSSASSSGYPRVDGNGQDENLDRSVDWEFSNVVIAARTGFGVYRPEVRNMLIQTKPFLDPPYKKPHNIEQKRRNRKERELWDPYGKWSSIEGCFPWMRYHFDVEVQMYGPGYCEVACGPSLCINQKSYVGWKSYILEEHDKRCRQEQACNVKEGFVVRSFAVPFVVVSALGPDEVHLVDGVRGSAVGRSASMEVNPPSVGHTSKNVAVSRNDTLVRSRGPIDCPQIVSRHEFHYNKLIGGVRAAIDPIHFRNIRTGMPAIEGGWHIGKSERFATRTYVHNCNGRKSNVNGSIVRVRGGHHEGKNCVAPGCVDDPFFLQYCRIVDIDMRKLRWCSVDSVVVHSSKWPKDVRKAKSIVRTLVANHCDWAGVLIVCGRCFGFHLSYDKANRTLEILFWNWSKLK